TDGGRWFWLSLVRTLRIPSGACANRSPPTLRTIARPFRNHHSRLRSTNEVGQCAACADRQKRCDDRGQYDRDNNHNAQALHTLCVPQAAATGEALNTQLSITSNFRGEW